MFAQIPNLLAGKFAQIPELLAGKFAQIPKLLTGTFAQIPKLVAGKIAQTLNSLPLYCLSNFLFPPQKFNRFPCMLILLSYLENVTVQTEIPCC